MADDTSNAGADDGLGARHEAIVQKFSPLPTGTRLGEVIIQTVLGAGEFGITYIAEHEGSGRRFALKEYLPRAIAYRDGPTVRVPEASMPAFAWGLERFLTEGRALTKVRHAAILTVHSALEGNGTGYMVMAQEPGRDLVVWMHELRRPPTQEQIDKVLAPLLEGLAAVHAKDLLHLEITPSSILIRDNGTPVLLDFGAVRLGMRRRLNAQTPPAVMPYMSPEVAAADANLIGPRSDIYSVAAVLYTMVTGSPPPVPDKRVLRDELVPAAEAAKGKYRPGFLAAIDAGLRFRPDERPQRIASWQSDLMGTEPARPAARKAEPQKAEATAAARSAAPASASAEPGPAADEGKPLSAMRRRMASSKADDDADEAGRPKVAEPIMENEAFRSVFFGVIGAIGGAIAGALSSIVLASVLWSSCFADSCVMPLLPYTAAAGALAGLYFGVQYGRTTATRKPLLPSIGED